MKVKIQVVIESDDGHIRDVEEVACLKRGMLTAEELGLNLAEAKQILHNVQNSMLGLQVAEYQATRKNCAHCERPQPQKGRHAIVFRTLFGKLALVQIALLHASQCGRETWEAHKQRSSTKTNWSIYVLEWLFAPELAWPLTAAPDDENRRYRRSCRIEGPTRALVVTPRTRT